MASRHLLDPEIAPLVERFAGFVMSAETLQQGREQMRAGLAARPEPPADVIVTEAWAAPGGDAPDVRLIITAPREPGADRPCILHIHGGGYVRGAAEMTIDTDVVYA